MPLTLIEMPPPPKPAETADGRRGRRIEWIGEGSPFDDPFVEFGVATGRYTAEQVDLLRRVALRACKRTETNTRILDQRDPGLSTRVEWGPGPGNWVRVLTNQDADKVLSSASAHEFRDLDAHERDEPRVVHPPLEVRLVEQEVLRQGDSVERGMAILRGLGPQ